MTKARSAISLKVGELATRGGVTVRTLHHYEEIGLLEPSERTAASHRLYSEADRLRLDRINTLRRIGFGLNDVAALLDGDDATALQLLEQLKAANEAVISDATHRRSTITSVLERMTDEADLVALLSEAVSLTTTVRRNISIVVYRDLVAAYDFLSQVFELAPAGLSYNETGRAVHGEMLAGDTVVWLHPEAPRYHLYSAATLGGASGSMAVMVDDVDEHHARAREHGAAVVYEPVDQPYGYRDYSALDSEGGLWSFMKRVNND